VKNIRYILLLLVAVCATGAQAQAAPVYNWTGFYVGAHGGYLRGDYDIDVPGAPGTAKPDGAYGGFQLGYWAHFSPNWVYGFEADISYSDANGAGDANSLNVWLDRFGTARTRFGYATGPWLIYAAGGLAWAKVSAGNTVFHSRQAYKGWTAGVGAEYAIAPNWSVKAEYLFADLGDNTENLFLFGSIRQDVTFSTIRVGLNYRLGGPLPATNAAPRARFNWSGGYIGIQGGYADGTQSMTYLGGTVPFEPNGGFGGFQTGYNWQFASNLVLGVESDFAFAGIKGHFMGDCCTVKIEQFGTARLRAGYAFDNILIYATGGIAWAKTDNYYLNALFTTDRPLIGSAAGAGVEYAFAPMWTVKAEYLRLYFDHNRTEFVGLTQFRERAEYDIFRVGLNYRASLFDMIARR
jgi:outer membrane immunogenic protein